MAIWLQHLLVALIVAGSAFYVAAQAMASLRGRGGRVGGCCAKGCGGQADHVNRQVFVPVEALRRKR